MDPILVWRSGEDARVCSPCQGLDGCIEGDGWSRDGCSFGEVVGPPPLHLNCRCWIEEIWSSHVLVSSSGGESSSSGEWSSSSGEWPSSSGEESSSSGEESSSSGEEPSSSGEQPSSSGEETPSGEG
jgi:hypothetical protein